MNRASVRAVFLACVLAVSLLALPVSSEVPDGAVFFATYVQGLD
jgi:hypothetical protein